MMMAGGILQLVAQTDPRLIDQSPAVFSSDLNRLPPMHVPAVDPQAWSWLIHRFADVARGFVIDFGPSARDPHSLISRVGCMMGGVVVGELTGQELKVLMMGGKDKDKNKKNERFVRLPWGFPLIAMQYHECTVRVELSFLHGTALPSLGPIHSLVTAFVGPPPFEEPTLVVDFVYMDMKPRRHMAQYGDWCYMLSSPECVRRRRKGVEAVTVLEFSGETAVLYQENLRCFLIFGQGIQDVSLASARGSFGQHRTRIYKTHAVLELEPGMLRALRRATSFETDGLPSRSLCFSSSSSSSSSVGTGRIEEIPKLLVSWGPESKRNAKVSASLIYTNQVVWYQGVRRNIY